MLRVSLSTSRLIGGYSRRVRECHYILRTKIHQTGIVINYWTEAVPLEAWMIIFIALGEHSSFAIFRSHLVYDPSFPCQLSWCQGVRRTRVLVLQHQSDRFDRFNSFRYHC